MKTYLLPSGRKPVKANLHCHSTFSDGRYEVARLKELYLSHGYSVVAFSDHNVLVPHPELSGPDFIPITATEINVDNGHGKTYHLNFFAPDPELCELPAFERVYSVEGINRLISAFNERGFLSQYNHPRWSFQNAGDFIGLKGLWGFEVFNTGCELEMHNGWGDYEYEVYCREGLGGLPAAVATDDNHNGAGDPESPFDDSFGGWTVLFPEKLDYSSVFAAMKNKELYCTTGPEIKSLYVEDGRLFVECSPACSVNLRCDNRRAPRMLSHCDDVTGAVFDIDPSARHIRLEIKDSRGRRALTRAYENVFTK